MRMVKGIIIGSAITAAAYMMCSEGMINKRKMMKQALRPSRKSQAPTETAYSHPQRKCLNTISMQATSIPSKLLLTAFM